MKITILVKIIINLTNSDFVATHYKHNVECSTIFMCRCLYGREVDGFQIRQITEACNRLCQICLPPFQKYNKRGVTNAYSSKVHSHHKL